MKLLFLTSRFPFPLEKGDKLRAYHQIKSLSSKADIYLFAVNENAVPEEDLQELRPFCKSIEVAVVPKWTSALSMMAALFQPSLPMQVAYFTSSKAKHQLQNFIRVHQPNTVFCHLIRMGEYLNIPEIHPLVLDYMDTFSIGMNRRAAKSFFPLSKVFKLEEARLKKYEEILFRKCDHQIVISEQDRDAFSFQGKEKVEVVANGVDFDYYVANPAPSTFDMLFIGNMAYPPNISSCIYAVKEILPALHKLQPNANLIIAGADPVLAIRNLANEHVRVVGWVEDPRKLFSEARIMIAPMQISIGLQNKIIQAMAMKLPCVISRLANNAIGAPEDTCVLVAETPDEYARQIERLLNDKNLRDRIAENAYEFVHRHFNWDINCQKIFDLLQKPGSAIE